ncbi:serine protease [Novosphingobium sp.]|uniref:serine protease n=1 Tax=Novosphingobium sp. TaxID=1874826 RepID=UPI0025FE3F63|nr:serine protease [Novosphingobium sp.]
MTKQRATFLKFLVVAVLAVLASHTSRVVAQAPEVPTQNTKVITDRKTIARIVKDRLSRDLGFKVARQTCTSEWICSPRKLNFYSAYDPVTHAYQGSSTGSHFPMFYDGGERSLVDLLGRFARAGLPSKPALQKTWIEQELSRSEREALDFALGMEEPSHCCAAGGGLPISIAAAPFAVEIRYRDTLVGQDAAFMESTSLYGARWQARHVCGGTLIAHDWVLTAAHCVSPRAVAGKLAVQLGVSDISGVSGHSVDVDGAVVHAGYNEGGGRLKENGPYDRKGNIYRDDIALLHLAADPAPRDPKSIAIATLAASVVKPGTPVEAVGWGRTRDVGDINDVTSLLRRVELTVLENDACARMADYGPVEVPVPVPVSAQVSGQVSAVSAAAEKTRPGFVARVHPGVLCVKGTMMKTCSGDSGGPLYMSDPRVAVTELVGVVSWNKEGCHVATDDRPGIYTRVSAYLGWIARARAHPPSSGQTILLP